MSVIGVAVPNRLHSGVFRMYLECAKGMGPGGQTEVPQWGLGAKPRLGIWGTKSPGMLTLFVTECLNFDVLEEKN